MKNIAGELVRFSDSTGKATLLYFWASWCDSCRTETQALTDLYHAFQKSGFELFCVSLDFDKRSWEETVDQDRLTRPIVSDLLGKNNANAIIYDVHTIPNNFPLDENGIIIARNTHGENLRHLIDGLLHK